MTDLNKIKLFIDSDTEMPELAKQCCSVALLQAPFDMINQDRIRSSLVCIEKKNLEHFNHHQYELGDKELVVLMMEAKENDLVGIVNMYADNTRLFDEFVRNKIVSSYYGLVDKTISNGIISVLNKMSDFHYWEDERNCTLSINKPFDNRKFNLAFMDKWALPVEEIEKELAKLIQQITKNKTKVKVANTNYPSGVTDATGEEKEEMELYKAYVDGSQTYNKSFFPITDVDRLGIKEPDVEELLLGNSLSEMEKYYLVCNFLASQKYCHFILRNQKILKATRPIFEKYKPVMRYLMGYAWITLYMEESIRKTRTKQSDRYVFDLETASELPIFPFSQEAPHLNPYFCHMISQDLLNTQYNIHGVKQIMNCQNGIVDIAEFKRRLNVFITGKSNLDLLVGANWSNMVITGGCMAAILPKSNPLMTLFKRNPDQNVPIADDELNRFFQEYYSNSDIDIACNHSNIIDFINHVNHLRDVICQNLGPNVKKNDLSIAPIKTLGILIEENILREKCVSGEIPFSYDYIVKNRNKNDVKLYFYEMYLHKKREENGWNKELLKDSINNSIYFEIIRYVNFADVTIIINISKIRKITKEISENDVRLNYYCEEENGIFINFKETLKYKISSKYFKHTIEVFRSQSEDFFACIARFHLPCVRSYYNGSNCYLLPSAITAYQTLTNIDFKYFVGSRDPIEIINKYRRRGYGTILNKIEISQVISYILNVGNYKEAYQVTDAKELDKIIGSLALDHPLFKPRKYVPEEFVADKSITMDYQNPKLHYDTTANEIQEYYKKYSKFNMDIQTINQNGLISPIKRWFIDATYDILK